MGTSNLKLVCPVFIDEKQFLNGEMLVQIPSTVCHSLPLDISLNSYTMACLGQLTVNLENTLISMG